MLTLQTEQGNPQDLSVGSGVMLVAYKGDRRIGEVVCNNDMTAYQFERVYGGLGDVYHLGNGNPFLTPSWDKLFTNPDLLPQDTQNIFLDQER